MTNYLKLEKKINISFKNKDILQNVFVHRSFLNEHKNFKLPSNEKMEFLGDSVLSLVTAIYLYKHYPTLNEGNYTDIKAAIVRTKSLADAARKLKLGEFLYLSKGEELNAGKDNRNILADTFEALVAAIFIDQDFEAAYQFIEKFLFDNQIDYIVEKGLYLSPKSRLQELIQAKYRSLPIYKIIEEQGPEHLKHFTIAVFINNTQMGVGKGSSKKEAEELAAKNALENI
jgi:ribonuclease III